MEYLSIDWVFYTFGSISSKCKFKDHSCLADPSDWGKTIKSVSKYNTNIKWQNCLQQVTFVGAHGSPWLVLSNAGEERA